MDDVDVLALDLRAAAFCLQDEGCPPYDVVARLRRAVYLRARMSRVPAPEVVPDLYDLAVVADLIQPFWASQRRRGLTDAEAADRLDRALLRMEADRLLAGVTG